MRIRIASLSTAVVSLVSLLAVTASADDRQLSVDTRLPFPNAPAWETDIAYANLLGSNPDRHVVYYHKGQTSNTWGIWDCSSTFHNLHPNVPQPLAASAPALAVGMVPNSATLATAIAWQATDNTLWLAYTTMNSSGGSTTQIGRLSNLHLNAEPSIALDSQGQIYIAAATTNGLVYWQFKPSNAIVGTASDYYHTPMWEVGAAAISPTYPAGPYVGANYGINTQPALLVRPWQTDPVQSISGAFGEVDLAFLTTGGLYYMAKANGDTTWGPPTTLPGTVNGPPAMTLRRKSGGGASAGEVDIVAQGGVIQPGEWGGNYYYANPGTPFGLWTPGVAVTGRPSVAVDPDSGDAFISAASSENCVYGDYCVNVWQAYPAQPLVGPQTFAPQQTFWAPLGGAQVIASGNKTVQLVAADGPSNHLIFDAASTATSGTVFFPGG